MASSSSVCASALANMRNVTKPGGEGGGGGGGDDGGDGGGDGSGSAAAATVLARVNLCTVIGAPFTLDSVVCRSSHVKPNFSASF